MSKIKHHTKARARIETGYNAAKQALYDEMMDDNGYVYCRGCDTTAGQITWSHRIPRSRRKDLIADKENIDPMCHDCHEKVEAGKYDELLNGEDIKDYIEANEPQLLQIKSLRKDNLAA